MVCPPVARLLHLSALALLLGTGVPALAADAGVATAKPAPSPTTAPATPFAKAGKPRRVTTPTTVVLFHLNRKETLNLRLRDGLGRPVKGLQKRMDRFLRCHYTNEAHAMNP